MPDLARPEGVDTRQADARLGLLDDLARGLEEQFERELLERAMEAVRPRVAPHNWQAFWRTAIEGRPAMDVARELHMTPTAVYVAKNRVGKMLRQAAERAGSDSPIRENTP